MAHFFGLVRLACLVVRNGKVAEGPDPPHLVTYLQSTCQVFRVHLYGLVNLAELIVRAAEVDCSTLFISIDRVHGMCTE